MLKFLLGNKCLRNNSIIILQEWRKIWHCFRICVCGVIKKACERGIQEVPGPGSYWDRGEWQYTLHI